MSRAEFDVVVIGAGPAGEVAAGRLADAGLSVAIVEDELVGGECSFHSCMPTKALLRPPQALDEARRIPGAAEALTGELDVRAVLARRDEVIHDQDDASMLPWLEDRGIRLFRGHGRLAGERAVARRRRRPGGAPRGDRRRRAAAPPSRRSPACARRARGPTGRSRRPSASPAACSSSAAASLGCEMAQAFARLGSRVTLVERRTALLGKEEPFAAAQVADGAARGRRRVAPRRARRPRAERRPDGSVALDLEGGTELEGDELLCALGRAPQTADLGLETIGLQAGGPIEVDDELAVAGHPWLRVIGDANGRALLTHAGKYQARVATDCILGRAARASGRRATGRRPRG